MNPEVTQRTEAVTQRQTQETEPEEISEKSEVAEFLQVQRDAEATRRDEQLAEQTQLLAEAMNHVWNIQEEATQCIAAKQNQAEEVNQLQEGKVEIKKKFNKNKPNCSTNGTQLTKDQGNQQLTDAKMEHQTNEKKEKLTPQGQNKTELSTYRRKMNSGIKIMQQQMERWTDRFLSNLSVAELQTLFARTRGQEIEFLKAYWALQPKIDKFERAAIEEVRRQFEAMAEEVGIRTQNYVILGMDEREAQAQTLKDEAKDTNNLKSPSITAAQINHQLEEQTLHLGEAVKGIRDLITNLKIGFNYLQPLLETRVIENLPLVSEHIYNMPPGKRLKTANYNSPLIIRPEDAGPSGLNKPPPRPQRIHPVRCPRCRGNHQLVECIKFRRLGNKRRRALVKKWKLCYKCLLPHLFRECNQQNCLACGRAHHMLICPGKSDIAVSVSDEYKDWDSLALKN